MVDGICQEEVYGEESVITESVNMLCVCEDQRVEEIERDELGWLH